MARSQLRTVFGLGLAATLLIGGSWLFAAEETAKPDTDASLSTKSAKSKSADDSGAKKWKNESASESKNSDAAHRPLPAIDYKNSAAVAAAVDKLILQNLTETGTNPAPKTTDEDFLRRVHFDLAGTAPLPNEVTVFGLDPDSEKRMKVIDKLLSSEDYAHNWSAYWRDVIFMRATDKKSLFLQGTFEKWMADQIRENQGWDKITTALLTAKGERRPGRRDCCGSLADLSGHPDSMRELSRPSERQVETATIPPTGRLLPPRAGETRREGEAADLLDRLF